MALPYRYNEDIPIYLNQWMQKNAYKCINNDCSIIACNWLYHCVIITKNVLIQSFIDYGYTKRNRKN